VEVIQLPLPAVITAQKGLNEPRYASLKGIMAAKKKSVEPVDLAGIAAAAPTVRTVSIAPPPPRPEGRRLDGDADSQVKELVRLLHEEYKVI
jgi:electron transfer flavoprotein beta subunit